MLELLKVIVIGIIQGITEWLPISSTGHMILANEFIKLNVSQSFLEMFLVVIQFGSILAVITLYFHKLNPLSPKKTKPEKIATFNMWFKVIVAILPLLLVAAFDDWFEETFYSAVPVSIALIVYGILFIILENRKKTPKINSIEDLSYKSALLIGLIQMLAVIPGTSRSGSTILGGILVGVSRTVAAEFSFFLAIPVMFGASLLKILKFGFALSAYELGILLLGMAVAYVVSVLAIKFLMNYIKKHDFKAFGYYRIVLGILVILYFTFC